MLVFDSGTFLLETVLEGRGEPVWQVASSRGGGQCLVLQVGAGTEVVTAVTEGCLTVWRKPRPGDRWGVDTGVLCYVLCCGIQLQSPFNISLMMAYHKYS